MPDESRTLSEYIRYRIFVIGLWVTQGVILYNMLNHTSTGGTIAGRYSAGYMLAIGVFAILALIWLPILHFRAKIQDWLTRLPVRGVLLVLMIAGLSTWGLWLFLGVEVQILFGISTNWFLIAGFILLYMPDVSVADSKRYFWLIVGSGFVLLPMIFITLLSEMQFSPDEAIWADFASTASMTGKMYARINARPPDVIMPGIGWFNLLQTWSLETLAFDIRTGRVWLFISYLLAIAGVGINAALLYGKHAGWLSVCVAFLSLSFFPMVDYRPHHFIPAASMLVVYCAIKGHLSARYSLIWHFLCGLVVTLMLQVHASGITYAAGFSLLYGSVFVYQSYRVRRMHNLRGLFAFGAGAALGTGLYVIFNVMPVGGIAPFLDSLVAERFSSDTSFRNLKYLGFYPPEMLLIVISFLVLLWRRSPADKLYAGFVISTVIGITFLNSQGYTMPYRPLFYMPIGAALIVIFQDAGDYNVVTRRGIWITYFAMILLMGQTLHFSITPQYVQYTLTEGELPSHEIMAINEDIARRVEDDDGVVVSTHELIWGLQYRDDFYGTIAEGTVIATRQYTDALDFWRDIEPDLIIEIEQRTVLPPRLLVYMDEEAFQPCEVFDAAGYETTFYRRTCPDTAD